MPSCGLTASAICGTDLHMVRGTLAGMKPGTILGHEGVGVIEELGKGVRNFRVGDRVVIGSTIACGCCAYCRAGYFAQCDQANPNGPAAGTSFFGGPKSTGPVDGLQAEFARVPFANVGMVRLPAGVSDDQAILLSDIFPTGYSGARSRKSAQATRCWFSAAGRSGQFAIASALLLAQAGCWPSIGLPRDWTWPGQGAEVLNFDVEDPVEAVRELTAGVGTDRAINAVGVDAVSARGRGRPTGRPKNTAVNSSKSWPRSRPRPIPTATFGFRATLPRKFCIGPWNAWPRRARYRSSASIRPR